jgi:hypothetical protein
MLHLDDSDAEFTNQGPVADKDPFAFEGLSFTVEKATLAASYAAIPVHTADTHFRGVSSGDWAVAPAVHVFFLLLTAVTVPLFTYRLALRFGYMGPRRTSVDE